MLRLTAAVAAIWVHLPAVASAARIPFLTDGSGMHIDFLEIVALDEHTGNYNVTITATNNERTIVEMAGDYVTTLRVSFTANEVTKTHGLAFCGLVKGGCPIAPYEQFEASFEVSLGSALRELSMAYLEVSIASGYRFLNSVNAFFTPSVSTAMEYAYGIVVPLGLLAVSAFKYLFIVWVDPEPVGTWNPALLKRPSGANELATIGSMRDIGTYFQFVALTLLVDVEYPHYYQAFYARITWVLGIWQNSMVSKLPSINPEDDGVLIPAGSSQLECVLYYARLSSIADVWPAVTISLLVVLGLVFACAAVSYWRSAHRWKYISSALLHYWFALISLPVIWGTFLSLCYLNKVPIPDDDIPTRPWAFPLSPEFYDNHIPSKAGIFFSMGVVLLIWLVLSLWTSWSMIDAKRKGYLTRANLILWGRFYNASHNDIFYHLHCIASTVLLAANFSFLSKQPLAQCIILLVSQLVGLVTASGSRPNELSYVGFVLIQIPRVMQIVVCCLLFTLIPTVLKMHPNMIRQRLPDRILYSIFAIHAIVSMYYFLLNVGCIGISIWRRLYLKRPAPISTASTTQYVEERIPSHMYYRKPHFLPESESDIEEDVVTTNYAVREVDFVYGINGAPKFMEKMFKPAESTSAGAAVSSGSLQTNSLVAAPSAPASCEGNRLFNKRSALSFFRKPKKESGFEVIRE